MAIDQRSIVRRPKIREKRQINRRQKAGRRSTTHTLNTTAAEGADDREYIGQRAQKGSRANEKCAVLSMVRSAASFFFYDFAPTFVP
jgi:hypothetical protein